MHVSSLANTDDSSARNWQVIITGRRDDFADSCERALKGEERLVMVDRMVLGSIEQMGISGL